MKSEPPSFLPPTKIRKFLNLFICLYRYLTEKSFWPKNYAAYIEVNRLFRIIDKNNQIPNRKAWYTGNFTGIIIDVNSEQPFPMSKHRAERLVSSLSGGKVVKIAPDPIWFSVLCFIFHLAADYTVHPLVNGCINLKNIISEYAERLSGPAKKCSGSTDSQNGGPVFLGALVIQNQLYLHYDRELNQEIFPPFSDFKILVCGKRRRVGGMGYAGTRKGFLDMLLVILETSVSAGEEVKISYQPSNVSIGDLKGNSVRPVKDVLVRNFTR